MKFIYSGISLSLFMPILYSVWIRLPFVPQDTSIAGKNDGGVDGIIQADKLGFDRIYVQAKKYTGSVGRPDIQRFVGAMPGTYKGVFITTSDFTSSAVEYISTRPENIILINGSELVDLMYQYNQGVYVRKTLEIKSIDADFWDELE